MLKCWCVMIWGICGISGILKVSYQRPVSASVNTCHSSLSLSYDQQGEPMDVTRARKHSTCCDLNMILIIRKNKSKAANP